VANSSKDGGSDVTVGRVSDLIQDEKNANKGTKRGAAFIESSLKSYGAGRSILLDKKGRIIAGNKTTKNAAGAGIEDVIIVKTDGKQLVAVQRTDLDLKKDKAARELALADNRASELDLDWNPEILANIDVELSRFWNDSELQKVLGDFAPPPVEAPEPKLDKAKELQRKWKTLRGQIWEAGPHRLMCGDSGAPGDVGRLFAHRRAWLIQTDPPYGVCYGVSSGPDSAKRFAPISNDEADGPKLQAFLEGVFKTALPFLEPGASWYLWHAQMTQGFFAAAAAAAAQVKVHRQIIWAKSHFILGHGDYHWQHELCFYGWREGEKHRWFGDRSQSTLWAIDNPRVHENHPTEKPPEIFARPMRLNTQPGEICYEPFAGSGSQFCAAQQLERVCYGIEIEPKYTAVTLERLSEMGLTPKLVRRG